MEMEKQPAFDENLSKKVPGSYFLKMSSARSRVIANPWICRG